MIVITSCMFQIFGRVHKKAAWMEKSYPGGFRVSGNVSLIYFIIIIFFVWVKVPAVMR